MSETQKISNIEKPRNEAGEILLDVYSALKEKGYNPVSQIVGYILSGDPTYITSHKSARSTISRLERDELLEEMVHFYLKYYSP
ncbi:MAG: IreB family regulatory phosphoprotein [Defluviitaleaceae bacterium]|nr:IreB family regulatory phosphoprotein [Defluviitaleaceae bacterium]